jgi:hypothetical protein
VAGLTALMNPERIVDTGLTEAEYRVMHGSEAAMPPSTEEDPEDSYLRQLDLISKNLGISLNDEDEGVSGVAPPQSAPTKIWDGETSEAAESDYSVPELADNKVLICPPTTPKVLDRTGRKREDIVAVLGTMRDETQTFRGDLYEHSRERKGRMIEQISHLRMSLEESNIDCNLIEIPDISWSEDQIRSVLNTLSLKNDRVRYVAMADEVILGIAEGIEALFDGSRSIFGWQPDYRGYHNTVNAKLYRMRFDTSQVVGSVIEHFRIGPLARIALELLPSFILYPRQRSRQREAPGLQDDPALRRAATQRNAYAEIQRKDLEDV